MITSTSIHLMFEEGVTSSQQSAIQQGIKNALARTGLADLVPIRNLGVWREIGYRTGTRFVPYQSVDWYVFQGIQESRNVNHVDADVILDRITTDPYKHGILRLDVIVLKRDIYSDGNLFVTGVARSQIGVVMSVFRYKRQSDQREMICQDASRLTELMLVRDMG